jgi:hypothetical protein
MAPEAVEPHVRAAPATAPSVVPGWEALRDRLSPDEEPF